MRILLIVTAFISVAVLSLADSSLSSAQSQDVAEKLGKIVNEAPAPALYGALPLHFEQNVGQVNEQVKFLTRGSGYSLFLTANEAVMAVTSAKCGARSEKQNCPSQILKMKIAGANQSAIISGENLLGGKTNYITGNDPNDWKTDIANYERVRYSNVYDGIDVVYYGNGRQLEYDFVISPGADPGGIELAYSGTKKIRVDANGDLIFKLGESEVRQHKPIAYQEIDGTRHEIAANYIIQNSKSKNSNSKDRL